MLDAHAPTEIFYSYAHADEPFRHEAALRDIAMGIRQAIEDLLPLSASTLRPARPSVWNIPYPRNPVFTGREKILTDLASALKTSQVTALSQPQAISHLGGIGKTQIAVEFAYQHYNEYQSVLWALADTRESLVSGYIAIATLLNLPEKDDKDQQVIIQAVKTWLQTHDSWLLILDNADDLSLTHEFVPSVFSGHLLFTTRAQATGRLANRMEVDTMELDTGALLLLRRAGRAGTSLDDAPSADVVIACKICEELGGLPLALDQAGAYIEDLQCSLSQYLKRYRDQRALLLEHRGGVISDHPESVATTWSLRFQKVERHTPAAANLLRLCAYLSPDAIPEEMITNGAIGPDLFRDKKKKYAGWFSAFTSFLFRRLGIAKGAGDRFVSDESIRALSASSLLRCDTTEHMLSIHRLVQAVVRDALSAKEGKQWMQRAVSAVNTSFPNVEFAQWMVCERYLPHALVCATWIEQEQMTLREAARLLNQTAYYLYERGQYAEAEPLFVRALAICERKLGAEHPDTASCLNNLAALYDKQGKYAEAKPLFRRALAIRARKLGSEHPDTASSLNNLAVLYSKQGKYAEARLLFRRALAIRAQKLGAEHPDTASCLNNLAALYDKQGKYADAEPLYMRALEIYERQLGEMHPNTQVVRRNYDALLPVMGREAKAIEEGR